MNKVKESVNDCPICGAKMKEDNHMYFCDCDGTSIDKKEHHIRVKQTKPNIEPNVNQ